MATGARWRTVLAAEVREARRRPTAGGLLHAIRAWFQTEEEQSSGAPGALGALARAPVAWDAPGLVALTDEHLVLHGPDGLRRTSLHTITAAEWGGAFVWVRRRRAHGWLLSLKSEADAERVWEAIGDAIG